MSREGLFKTISTCRHFFLEQGFIETPTPPAVPNPGMEAHLHPFQLLSVKDNKSLPLYLHTSPEFYMKELLSQGFEKIYNISWCFRDEPKSETHRPQFLMIEWYRANKHYHDILKDTLDLIQFTHQKLLEEGLDVIPTLPIKKVTVNELFRTYLGFSILDFLEVDSIEKLILEKFPELLSEKPKAPWPWEDYFFLIFLNKIEIEFVKYPLLVVDEFPAPLAALSTLKKADPRVCERFEIYLRGIELCNCFNELTELSEQEKRMKDEAKKKMDLYKYELPEPQILYNSLKKGLPPSAGIALGIERLYLGLMKEPQKVNPFFD